MSLSPLKRSKIENKENTVSKIIHKKIAQESILAETTLDLSVEKQNPQDIFQNEIKILKKAILEISEENEKLHEQKKMDHEKIENLENELEKCR